ncbi:ATP-binding cassette domain-containing protein [Roseibium sp. Sym1]|uniref:ATP-binding cassette domain-containing protein n=1 Tax=Roseibium sp. Sym1 TaxID=3016006 RepID=UPI0022B2E2EC|nr:ATP-binding cassette domain-containing protein [Roseibium sp. Sym1]
MNRRETSRVARPTRQQAHGLRSEQPALAEREASTPLEEVLPKVLGTMGWRRSEAVFSSALPGNAGLEHVEEAAVLLELLDFAASVERGLPQAWSDGLDGAVVALSGGEAYAIVRVNGIETLHSSAPGRDQAAVDIVAAANRVLHVRMADGERMAALAHRSLMRRLRRGIRHGLFLSLFINALAALVPLFSMEVFDRVIGARAPQSLWPLIAGGAVVVFCVWLLRRSRARYLAGERARLSSLAGLAAELRLLRAPLDALHRQSVARLDARIAAARRFADLFASANTPAVFDAPFILISLVLIAFIGGLLVIVPAVYLLLFVGVALLVHRRARETDPELAEAGRRRTAMLHELGAVPTALRESGVGQAWLKRFADTAKLAARAEHAAATRRGAVQALGAILGTGAALATLAVGVDLAIAGSITPGALVGAMMLTWRITGPAQGFFLGLPRLQAARAAAEGLERIIATPTLATCAVALERMPADAPSLECAGAWFRYDTGNEAALSGVNFRMEPGTVTVVMGPNGAGKTTLLRLLSGALIPQAGNVLLNGLNLRRYDPDEVALASLILPAGTEGAFDEGGSRHWNPRSILDKRIAGILGDDERGDDGRAGTNDPAEGPAPLILLDDPLAAADPEERTGFEAFVTRARGRSTLVFTTHDTSLVPLADNALVLDHGAVVYFGPVAREDTPALQLGKV